MKQQTSKKGRLEYTSHIVKKHHGIHPALKYFVSNRDKMPDFQCHYQSKSAQTTC